MDISIFGIGTVAAITVLCYLIGSGVKTTPLDNKYIPVICGCTGLVLGLVAMYAGMPEFPATDPITAAAVGARYYFQSLLRTGYRYRTDSCRSGFCVQYAGRFEDNFALDRNSVGER